MEKNMWPLGLQEPLLPEAILAIERYESVITRSARPSEEIQPEKALGIYLTGPMNEDWALLGVDAPWSGRIDPFATDGDLFQALRADPAYEGLFELIEIDRADWSFLPSLPRESFGAPLSFSAQKELIDRGYLEGPAERVFPSAQQSVFAATGPMMGTDGKVRRWIYRTDLGHPVLSWLNPHFTAQKVSSGLALGAVAGEGRQLLVFEPPPYPEALALMIRKLGAFSVALADRSIEDLAALPTDLMIDFVTRAPFVHGLTAENSEVLQLIFRLFLEANFSLLRLVHVSPVLWDEENRWTEFLLNPKKTYKYGEEFISGELLERRLLRIDAALATKNRLGTPPSPLFPKGEKELELILSTYALLPGSLLLSPADFPEIRRDLQRDGSFASKLRSLLDLRFTYSLDRAELIDVPASTSSLLLLLLELPRKEKALFVLNLSSSPSSFTYRGSIRQTRAIELVSHLQVEKNFGSDTFSFEIAPRSFKLFHFQPQYYGK
jgi:hypothetical protein